MNQRPTNQPRLTGPMPRSLWNDLALFATTAEADRLTHSMVSLTLDECTETDGGAFILRCIIGGLDDVAREQAKDLIDRDASTREMAAEDFGDAAALRRRVMRVYRKVTGTTFVICVACAPQGFVKDATTTSADGDRVCADCAANPPATGGPRPISDLSREELEAAYWRMKATADKAVELADRAVKSIDDALAAALKAAGFGR
ncbi:MAG: hypothetical protein JWM10_4095 [Myxococcaceae bacterium]|nr:hypothetical protein [Myxococcaceae bacterium]